MIFVTPGTITGQGIVPCLNPVICTRKQTDSCVVIPAALLTSRSEDDQRLASHGLTGHEKGK